MTTRVVKPEELTRDELRVWHAMLQANPRLNSPFFLPEFTLAVSAVRSGVRVIVEEQDDFPSAFLPYQSDLKRSHVAVGGAMNDFQGLICEPGRDCSMIEILERSRINQFRCHKLLDWRNEPGDFVLCRNSSPFVDLSNGIQAWKSDLQNHGSEQLKQIARKERKLAREYGAIRFDFKTTAPDVLETLIQWKQRQYHRTREMDIFAHDWTVKLLTSLLASPKDSHLQPVLSGMYAGNRLVAAHFGLMSNSVVHWWFPAYDPEYGRYSPGKILLCKILEESARLGVVRFDFGAGDESYKDSFANGSVEICRAVVDRNAARRWLRTRWFRARMAMKTSAFGPIFRDARGRMRALAAKLRRSQSTAADSVRLNAAIPSQSGPDFNESHAQTIARTSSDRQQKLFIEAKAL